eukprot:2385436-Pleurochrysis_carterae.AAC.9
MNQVCVDYVMLTRYQIIASAFRTYATAARRKRTARLNLFHELEKARFLMNVDGIYLAQILSSMLDAAAPKKNCRLPRCTPSRASPRAALHIPLCLCGRFSAELYSIDLQAAH